MPLSRPPLAPHGLIALSLRRHRGATAPAAPLVSGPRCAANRPSPSPSAAANRMHANPMNTERHIDPPRDRRTATIVGAARAICVIDAGGRAAGALGASPRPVGVGPASNDAGSTI